jgi:penicillin-insensitive murein endopeptidase
LSITGADLSKLLFKLKLRGAPLLLPLGLFVLCGVLAWGISVRFTAPLINPWALVKTPIGEPPMARSIGSYSAGCLLGGLSLPPDGPGFQLMRLTRRRFYGNPVLIDYIMKLSDRVSHQGLGTLLIGDLGQPRGGPTNSNHRSHQTGLDVDIWFWRPVFASRRILTLDEREALSAPSFVSGDGERVNTAWTKEETKLLRTATSFENVERIFVHAAIKRHLCKTEKHREWLRKLRPWYGHDDHFHVRLKCPPGHPECAVQESTPPGDGCDSSLDWWFGEEARHKGVDESDTGTVQAVPKLPAECDRVLAGTL